LRQRRRPSCIRGYLYKHAVRGSIAAHGSDSCHAFYKTKGNVRISQSASAFKITTTGGELPVTRRIRVWRNIVPLELPSASPYRGLPRHLISHYHAQWDPHVCPISTNHNEASFLLETARPRKSTLLTTRLDAFCELVFRNGFLWHHETLMPNDVLSKWTSSNIYQDTKSSSVETAYSPCPLMF
jgi:hypothetical protein